MRPLRVCLLVAALASLGAAPPAVRVDALGDPLPRDALARLGTGRFRLSSPTQNVVLSPDGRTLAAIASDREQVILFDADTGRELRRIAAAAVGLAFLGDGRELVCTDDEGTVTFWDPRQGKSLRKLTVKSAGRDGFALSGDGQRLVTAARGSGRRQALVVYDVRTGRQLTTLEAASGRQASLALSPDGKWLATWTPEPASGRGGPGGRGRRFSSDDETPRASPSPAVQLWDPVTGKVVHKLDAGAGESIAGAAFSPDRRTLVLATGTGGVQVWDVASGKRLRSFRAALPARVAATRECVLAFSPDGKTLVIGVRAGDAPLAWDLDTGRRLRTARAPECRFQGVGFRAGRIVAFGLAGQSVVVWDLLSGKRHSGDAGHTAPITALAFHSAGARLYTSSADGSVIEWASSGKELRRLPGPRPLAFGFGPGRRPLRTGSGEGAFAPGGAYLVSSERFSGLAVRDVQTGQDVLTLAGARTGSSSLAFRRDGELLAVAFPEGRRGGVRLYKLSSGEEVGAYDGGGFPATLLAFDPTGRRLAVGLNVEARGAANQQFEVHLWRVDLQREDPDFTPFPLPVTLPSASCLLFSPDGRFLLVVDARGVVHLLDARTGRELDILNVNETITTPPLLSPDGRSLAVAATRDDGSGPTLALWELASGKRRWSIRPDAPVTALAFSPSGQVLATGHRDSSALLWSLSGRRATAVSSVRVRPADLEDAWAALLSDDAERAFRGIRLLAAGGEAGVAVLRKRLGPAGGKPPDAATLARLVRELDDEAFAVRRKAFETLAAEGPTIEAALRKSLEGKPSAEVKRRLHELLARLRRPGVEGEQLRGLRALEALEWLGTPAARKLIDELTHGRADAPLTQAAVATRQRFK